MISITLSKPTHNNRNSVNIYKLNFIRSPMSISPAKSPIFQESHSIVIKPLKPLIFNFFISDRPNSDELTLEQKDIYAKSFVSQRLESKHNQSFKPTINFKKLNDQPKFRLSLEKKKTKVMNGMGQKASSERPSRNSYRGSKIKTISNKSVMNQEEFYSAESKDQRIEPQERQQSALKHRKTKQPHLHFNLTHLLKTSRTFTGHFNRQANIQGSNFAYYNYFLSEKSSLPKTQRSSRNKSRKVSENERYLSSTVGVRQFQYNI